MEKTKTPKETFEFWKCKYNDALVKCIQKGKMSDQQQTDFVRWHAEFTEYQRILHEYHDILRKMFAELSKKEQYDQFYILLFTMSGNTTGSITTDPFKIFLLNQILYEVNQLQQAARKEND